MKIKFKATENMVIYNGFYKTDGQLEFFKFTDGQVQDVPDGKGRELLADFPKNFSAEPKQPADAKARDISKISKDRMIKEAKTR